MNYIDLVLCVPITWGLYKGFSKGLIFEAASFIAFGFAIAGSLKYSDIVALKIHDWLNFESSYLKIIAFVVTFLAIVIFVNLLAKVVHKLAEGMALGGINKIGGALFGSLKYALILSLAIFIIDAVEKSYPVFSLEKKESSLLYSPVGMIAPVLIPGLGNADISALIPKNGDELKEK